MPEQAFELTVVVRVFLDGMELAEALGFPEISCVGETPAHWQRGLRAKARDLLGDSKAGDPLRMHRRQIGAGAEVAEIRFELEAPARRADWKEPVAVRLHFVRWSEGELHHA